MTDSIFKPGGIVAIIIFILIIFGLIISTTYYHKSLQLTIPQLLLLIIIKLSFFFTLIYSFVKVYKNPNGDYSENHEIGDYNEHYRIYKLFSDGGWKNFQLWYASLASDIVNEVIFMLLLFSLPLPFIPKGIGRIKMALIKLGLYKLSLIVILGKPSYIINSNIKHKLTKSDIGKLSTMYILVALFLGLIIYEFITYKQYKNKIL